MARKVSKKIQAAQLNAIIKRLKRGKMPRADSKLGILLANLEANLKAETGKSANNALKVGLVLQLAVLIAELPMLTPKGDDVNGAYKWAVDSLRAILADLYPKRKAAANPSAPTLGDIIGS